MKSWIKKVCCLSLLLSGSALCTITADEEKQAGSNPTVALSENAEIDIDKLSNAMGHLLAKNLKNPSISFNMDQMILGMREEVEGKPSPLSEEECYTMIAQLQEQILQNVSANNLKEAAQFLESNAKQEGVISLEPKLQYQVLADAPASKTDLGSVKESSTPLIHYQGRLLDGTEFSSSYDQDPIAVPMDKTIPGFSKGLLGMKEGEKRRLYIHPDLAYGTMGHLPPNSLLIFDVEIIKLENSTASEGDLDTNTAESS